MEIKQLNKKEESVLKRTNYLFEIDFSGKPTPSREEIRENIAKAIKIDKENFVIYKINTKFGEQKAKVNINAYKNQQDLKDIEPKYIILKNFKKQQEQRKKAAKAEEVKKENVTESKKEVKAEKTEKKEVKANEVNKEVKEKEVKEKEIKEKTTESKKEVKAENKVKVEKEANKEKNG